MGQRADVLGDGQSQVKTLKGKLGRWHSQGSEVGFQEFKGKQRICKSIGRALAGHGEEPGLFPKATRWKTLKGF